MKSSTDVDSTSSRSVGGTRVSTDRCSRPHRDRRCGSASHVVRRAAEPAIVVDFDANGGPDGARRMLLLGYLLGNQHAPLDVSAHQVSTPLMTSATTAKDTLAALRLQGVVADVPLASHGWSNTSADHHHHHHHD